jgi:OOP family OmpA-OmpF porin
VLQLIAISLKRANAVKNYFIKSGISSDRLEAVGYGEIKPIASNSTAEGREKNRRIEIYVEGVNDE